MAFHRAVPILPCEDVDITVPLADRAYGLRDFAVRTPTATC